MKLQDGDITFLIPAKEMEETYRKLYPRSDSDDFLKQMLPHAGKQFTISSVHNSVWNDNSEKVSYNSKEGYENINAYSCWSITEEFLALPPDHDFMSDSQENILKLFQ